MDAASFIGTWWKETSYAHNRAEADFGAMLYDKTIGEPVRQGRYQHYLCALRVLHEEVESRMEALKEDPAVAPFYDPRIFRVRAIEADMELCALVKASISWLKKSPEFAPRTARIQSLQPHELVSAWFTLEMAPMYGGQAIKKKFDDHPTLKGITNLYEYGDGIDVKTYRNEVTAKLEKFWPTLDPKQKKAFMNASSDIFVDICQITPFASQLKG